jgi:cytochrome c biogenesis protein
MTAPTAPKVTPPDARSARRSVELLSSMRFAIALLTLICIASVIGTVVKQHEPAVNYVNQFGPFWAELFGRSSCTPSTARVVPADPGLSGHQHVAVHRAQHAQDPADLRTYKENMREGA